MQVSVLSACNNNYLFLKVCSTEFLIPDRNRQLAGGSTGSGLCLLHLDHYFLFKTNQPSPLGLVLPSNEMLYL